MNDAFEVYAKLMCAASKFFNHLGSIEDTGGRVAGQTRHAENDNQLKQKLIKLIENLHLNKAYLQAYFTLEFQSNIREQSPYLCVSLGSFFPKKCVCFSKRKTAKATVKKTKATDCSKSSRLDEVI